MNDHVATAGANVLALAATLGAYSEGLIGLPFLPVLWGLFGALTGLAITPPESRRSALITVLFSWACGAAGGFALEAYLGGGKATMIGGSFLIGVGAKRLIPFLIELFITNASTWGKK